jgi:MFS transporter, OFA family, oxalate/formate antiporter
MPRNISNEFQKWFWLKKIGGTIRDVTGSPDYAFYLSGLGLIIAVVIARLAKRPMVATEAEVIKSAI